MTSWLANLSVLGFGVAIIGFVVALIPTRLIQEEDGCDHDNQKECDECWASHQV